MRVQKGYDTIVGQEARLDVDMVWDDGRGGLHRFLAMRDSRSLGRRLRNRAILGINDER